MAKVSPQKSKPQYDPTKNYKWAHDDVFELQGMDFSLLIQHFNKEIYNPTGTTVAEKISVHNLLQSILENAVEIGVAKEVEKPEESVDELMGKNPEPEKGEKA